MPLVCSQHISDVSMVKRNQNSNTKIMISSKTFQWIKGKRRVEYKQINEFRNDCRFARFEVGSVYFPCRELNQRAERLPHMPITVRWKRRNIEMINDAPVLIWSDVTLYTSKAKEKFRWFLRQCCVCCYNLNTSWRSEHALHHNGPRKRNQIRFTSIRLIASKRKKFQQSRMPKVKDSMSSTYTIAHTRINRNNNFRFEYYCYFVKIHCSRTTHTRIIKRCV